MVGRDLSNSYGRFLLLSVGLLLAYLFTRWHQPLLFPAFIDEVVLIEAAQAVYQFYLFLGAPNGRLFNLWWWALFDIRTDNILWLVRIVTSLWLLPAVALLLRIGRMLGTWWTGLFAASFYSLMPYALFYDRLALSDMYVMTWVLFTLWLSLRYTQKPRWQTAVGVAVGLIGLFLTKFNALVLLGVPLLTVVFLGEKLTWRTKSAGLVLMYGIFALFALPLYLLLERIGLGLLSVNHVLVADSWTEALARFAQHVALFGEQASGYFTAVFLIVAGGIWLGCARWQWRSALYWASMLLLPIGATLLVGQVVRPRYLHFHLAFLALGLASAVETLRRSRWSGGLPLLYGGFGLWVLLWALPFGYRYFTDPAQLPLPSVDRREYILAPPGGFGQPEAAHYLLAQQQQLDQPLTVVVLLANAGAFEQYLPPAAPITLRAVWWWETSLAAELHQLETLAQTTPTGTLWLVQEETPYTSIKTFSVPMISRAKFYRPDGATYIEVWQVQN
jgi:hypothetical protein